MYTRKRKTRKTRKQIKMKGGLGSVYELNEKVKTLMQKIEVLNKEPIYEDLQLIGQSFEGLKEIPSREQFNFLTEFNHIDSKYKDIRSYIEKQYFPTDIKLLKKIVIKVGFQNLADDIRQTMEPATEPVVQNKSVVAQAATAASPEKPKKKKKTASEALVEVFAGGKTRSQASGITQIAVKATNRLLGLKSKKQRK